ncbi:MAG: YgfZ/GcvT domain-containing protein [Acidobacteriota bacterium]
MAASREAALEDAYRAAHQAALLAEHSGRGAIILTGTGRLPFLQRVTTGDLKALQPGQGAPTLLVTGKGRLLDRLALLCRENDILVLSSAGARSLVFGILSRYVVFEDVTLADDSEGTCFLELRGPRASEILRSVDAFPFGESEGKEPDLYRHGPATLAGMAVRVVVEAGPPGAAFGILGRRGNREDLVRALREAGAPAGLVLGNTESLEVLRVEDGRPAFGKELSEKWNPLETRQEDAVSFQKGCYVGQEVIARLRTYGRTKRRLMRIRIEASLPVPEGSTLRRADLDGKAGAAADVGTVTSAVSVPGAGHAVALGMIDGEWGEPGSELVVVASGAERRARLVGPPPTARDVRVDPPAALAPGKRRFGQ